MANNTAKIENQHYVPQFLLKNFTVLGKPNQIIVFDKQSEKTFRTNIKNVAAEKGFYDFILENYKVTLEPSLSKLEGRAAYIVEKVVQTENLARVGGEDRVTLALFIAAQFVRVKGHRARWDDLEEKMMARIGPEATEELREEMRPSRETSQAMYLNSVVDCHEYVPYLLAKTWTLHKTTTANPFVIGDCPVTLHNMIDHRPYGNIGLAVRGIEIYLPLTKTLTLGLWCPTLQDRLRKEYDDAQATVEQMHEKWRNIANVPADRVAEAQASARKTLASSAETLRQIEHGVPLECSNDNVIYLNHLQVRYAERHVMSSKDDFSLARRMLSDSAQFKVGPRMELA